MKRLLIVGMGLLLVNLAHAANWKMLATNDTSSAYVDQASIERHGPFAQVWTKVIYKTAQADIKHPGKTFTIMKGMTKENCQNNTEAYIMAVMYSGDGNVEASQGPFVEFFHPIVPESLSDEIHQFVCTKLH